jgi:Predicted transcriptional regulator with C-terminal CBS domains
MGRVINREKLSQLKTASQHFDEKYGVEGTPTRIQFENETLLLFVGDLLKENRVKNNLTQQELAEKTGLERSYISKIEKGQTDMQISNFFKILAGLNLSTLELNLFFEKKNNDAFFAPI